MTTNIIVPLAKESSHGSAKEMWEADKNPIIAKIGSTIPLKIPKKIDFLRVFMQFCIVIAVASPSGKFCIPIPSIIETAPKN